jgi:hypothetical protein
VPYPKTELYEWLKEKGYLLEELHSYLNTGSRRRNHPLFITPELSFEDRKKAWKYTRRIKEEVIFRATRRKLIKLGIFGNVIAHAYGNFLLRNLFIGNKIVRKLVVTPVKKLAHLSK